MYLLFRVGVKMWVRNRCYQTALVLLQRSIPQQLQVVTRLDAVTVKVEFTSLLSGVFCKNEITETESLSRDEQSINQSNY